LLIHPIQTLKKVLAKRTFYYTTDFSVNLTSGHALHYSRKGKACFALYEHFEILNFECTICRMVIQSKKTGEDEGILR